MVSRTEDNASNTKSKQERGRDCGLLLLLGPPLDAITTARVIDFQWLSDAVVAANSCAHHGPSSTILANETLCPHVLRPRNRLGLHAPLEVLDAFFAGDIAIAPRATTEVVATRLRRMQVVVQPGVRLGDDAYAICARSCGVAAHVEEDSGARLELRECTRGTLSIPRSIAWARAISRCSKRAWCSEAERPCEERGLGDGGVRITTGKLSGIWDRVVGHSRRGDATFQSTCRRDGITRTWKRRS